MADEIKTPIEQINNETSILSVDIADETLIKTIDKYIANGKSLYETVKARSDINRKYWKGDQLDNKQLGKYQAKVVNNIIFRNMETMLPVITQNTPLPTFISSNKDMNRAMEQLMVLRWEVMDNMLAKNRKTVRSAFLDLLGVQKYRWDTDIKEIVWEYIKTWNVVIDNDATNYEDLEWVAEYLTDTVQNLIDKFPKSEDDLKKELGIKEDDDTKLGNKITYIEFWTPEMLVWKYKNIIFDKNKNPNWNWKEDGTNKKQNLWNRPRVPYNFLVFYNIDEHGLYGDTSLIEQTLTIQDGINKRKRQISDNADQANGTLVGSGDAISREEFSKIDDDPKLKIWIDSGNPTNAITRITGQPLQNYVFNDMQHSELAVDDIWGTHAITRGASSGAGTATQDVLQQRQDFGRIDDIVKAYEDLNEQYYQATFQMMLVYYDKEHTFSFDDADDLSITKKELINAFSKRIKRRVNEATGELETQTITGDFRPPIIMVKRGSTLPVDPVSKRTEALQLASAGRISTLDLLETLEFPNAREVAKNVWLEINQPEVLYPEIAQGGVTIPTKEAIEDFQRIAQGLDTPPSFEVENPITAEAHLKSHTKQLDSKEFLELDQEIQQNFIEHIKQEVDTTRQVMINAQQQIVNGAPESPQAPQDTQGGATAPSNNLGAPTNAI